MSNTGTDIAYYTLPVILSFEGAEKQINSKLGKAFGDVSKRASKSMADAAEGDVKRAVAAYERLRNRAEDALGKVRIEEEKLAKARSSGKTDQIVAAEERLAKARRDATRVNKEAASSYSDLLERQKRLTDGTGGLSSKLSNLTGSLGSVQAMGGPVGFAVAGITTAVAALGAATIAAGRELYDLGKQFDDLRDKLQIDTGASGAELQGLVDTVERLGTTNTASSFADIGAVVADVTRNLHLTGPALDDVASRISNLNRLTGQAVNVRDLGKAFRGFGIDAADQAGALNSLYEASTKSGMSVNDMLASVTKAGPALRQFGLSFGESAALVNTFEAAGVDTDKTLTTLNKAFAFFADAGVPARQGLQTVVTKIQELIAAGNDAAAADLTNKVFGAKGGVNFFELIRSGAIDLQALSTSMQTTGLDINDVAAKTADWSERWTILKNKSADALEPLGAAVFDFVNNKLDLLSTWVDAHQEDIINFFVSMGHAAIDAGAFIVNSFGDVLSTLGQIGGAFGDIQGGMLKFQAWQADIRGDTETAEQLRQQAEEAFSYGEGLTKMGDAMKAVDPTNLHKALDEAASKARGAATETGGFGEELGKLPEGVDVPVSVSGLDQASREMEDFFAKYSQLTVGVDVGDAAAAGVMAGTALGAGLPIVGTGQPYGLPVGSNTGGYGGPGQDMFPQWVRDLGAKFGVKPSTYPGHQESNGVNQGIDWVGTVDAMNNFAKALAAAKPAGLEQVIFQNPNTGEMTGLTPAGEVVKRDGGYYRDDWATHRDHVHTRFTQSVALPSVPVPSMSVPIPVAAAPPVVAVPAPVAAVPPAAVLAPLADYTANIPAGNDSLVSAFGPGYEPGIGRPGMDEYGKPGYYRVDPKSLREANQRADDAKAAIADYDAAIQAARADAEAARKAVEENPFPDPADIARIAGADEQVRKAEAAAAKARREAADAATDAAQVAKGEFTAAKEVAKAKTDAVSKEQTKPKSTRRGGADLGLSGLGSIAGSFLKDTFGIGDWLPALDNLLPLQAADTLIGMAVNTAIAGANGELNFQNPNWRPGMSQEDLQAASTSSSAFGLPDIAAPPMPQGSVHTGTGGAPGPTIVNVDQSQNFNNSPLGWDPDRVNKERDRNINRAPRLPLGMGS